MVDVLFSEESRKKALAHDIRGLLSVIQLAVDRLMLHEDRLVRKQCALVEEVVDKATDYCSETVQDTRKTDIEMVSLSSLIKDVNVILRPLAQQYNIDYSAVSIDTDIPLKTSTKLHRILVNLGRNAIQAQKQHSSGRLIILADSNDEKISIDIIDNGQGIPSSITNELFSQNITAYSDQKRRLGMGLTSSFAFARGLGGKIELLRTGWSGTHFKIQIPFKTSPTPYGSTLVHG